MANNCIVLLVGYRVWALWMKNSRNQSRWQRRERLGL